MSVNIDLLSVTDQKAPLYPNVFIDFMIWSSRRDVTTTPCSVNNFSTKFSFFICIHADTPRSRDGSTSVIAEFLKANKKIGIRQLLSLAYYKLPKELLGKGILMLGGSTHLHKTETYYEGDLSGIQASKIPFWFQYFCLKFQKVKLLLHF